MDGLVIGILAHVDAGKTTLSEAMLYTGGALRRMGRVDNRDVFLDTYAQERARGITIFSKQAIFQLENKQITLLDTPGHVDFSAEMERTLQVLDYAVLVVSGADGIQGHTQTLWQLLKKYKIPVFLFINKMDQPGTDKSRLLEELKKKFGEGCVDFGDRDAAFFEDIAMCDEAVLEHFLEDEIIEEAEIRDLISGRKVFPCYFGSALRLTGVQELLNGICRDSRVPDYPDEFGARVFKISRDEQGKRITHMKITGGTLKARTAVGEEKIHEIRIYSGEKYTSVQEAGAGEVCAVTGLAQTMPGQGLGTEEGTVTPVLEPVFTYRMGLPEGVAAALALPKLRRLEEEIPELKLVWDENLQEIQAQIMGDVQMEVLQSLIEERFGMSVEFGAGRILYKETIANPVEGVGHFEPLRHYAEVHLLLEPGEAGSGLEFAAQCSEDMLDRNWQHLVVTHLKEKEHRGVLAGYPITDMKITLIAGRAHQKHTEGGDFRQATYRAVRQGLREAVSILLEPYYDFCLEVPESVVGRAMTDLEKRSAVFELMGSGDGMSSLSGYAPVVSMRDYQREVTAYTKGHGKLTCVLKGYAPCHNAEEIISITGYDPEQDLENPTGSVFCSHGAGYVVSWDKVKEFMHVDSPVTLPKEEGEGNADSGNRTKQTPGDREEIWLGTDEIDAILERTYYANSKEKTGYRKGGKRTGGPREKASSVTRTYGNPEPKTNLEPKKNPGPEYLLVDGYNIIFAWDNLRKLAETNIDGARAELMDILCNYQAVRGCSLILVFDAYRVQGHVTEILDYHNIHVVYTKEAETADQYIEKFAHENGRKYRVTVATSDGVEQVIIRGQGCGLLSARDLKEEIDRAGREVFEDYSRMQTGGKRYLLDGVTEDVEGMIRGMGECEDEDGGK